MQTRTKRLVQRALAVTVAGLALVLPQAGFATADPQRGYAERTVVTPEGSTFNLKLSASPVGLPASGGTVAVTGDGYNTRQGIYLALCVIPRSVEVGNPSTYTKKPEPCLGGKRPTDGSARRITNDDIGTPGVTFPYDANGSFLTTLNLRAAIDEYHVCGVTVRCAIVTRSDLTATENRLYDQYIPVTFVH